LFDLKEVSGKTLPYNRFDVILAVLMAFSLLVMMSFASEPLTVVTETKLSVLALVVGIIWFIASHRKLVWGAALAIMAFRSSVGLLVPGYRLLFLGLTVFFGTASWLLLRDPC
jgi:hypothetical protein